MSTYTPSAYLNHVLDNGTIVGRSPLRSGGHPDCDSPADADGIPSAAEIEAFMDFVEIDQANTIVAEQFERDVKSCLDYVKRFKSDALVSITRTFTYTSIAGVPSSAYHLTIYGPMMDRLAFARGDTMTEALHAAVATMNNRMTA